MKRLHFSGLDFVRFIAALIVVFFHFQTFGKYEPDFRATGEAAAMGWLAPAGWFGWVGVQVFFVLSGIVIAASAERSLPSHFAVKRAIRLLPTLWVSATIALAIRLAWGEGLGELIVPYLNALFLNPAGPFIDGVVWTLLVEAVFYALVALAIYINRLRGKSELRLSWLAYIIGGVSTLFLAASGLAHTIADMPLRQTILQLDSRFYMDFLLLRHGVFFALGILMLDWVKHGRSNANILAMAIFAAMGLLQISLKSGLETQFIVPCLVWLLATGLIALSISPYSPFNRPEVTIISRPLGLMTYPLYLNHFTLGTYATPLIAGYITNSFALFVVMLALVLAVSAFVTFGPEKFIQAWCKSKIGKNGENIDRVTGWLMDRLPIPAALKPAR